MFLPVSKEDMKKQNIDRLDFVYISGDAYVDHSAFAAALVSRVLLSHGYTVGIIAQPDLKDPDSLLALGVPRLGVLVSSGNIDSMVNHYTAAKKRRSTDFYSPGGKIGLRPDRAVIVYCNAVRRAFGNKMPLVIGGIEASLRRFAHYDYWSDNVRRSILIDSGADILIYGMGEHQIVEIADLLSVGTPVKSIRHIAGTVYAAAKDELSGDEIILPPFSSVSENKIDYAKAVSIMHAEQDAVRGKTLAQFDSKKFVVQNPPSPPLTTAELDEVYELPFEWRAHPMYDKYGGVPAIDEIKFSLTSCRGCFGGCNFCALNFHQGRTVTVRSHDSLIREATKITKLPDFKGYIHDVGGPTANFRAPSCKNQLKHGVCKNRQCLFPTPCKNLEVSHRDYLELLRKLRRIPGVKKVFVRSGIRYDYLIADKDDEFFYELCKQHISGQLRIAPEHISDNVLHYMGKPSKGVYDKFIQKFDRINREIGKEQYAVPYLMSSHPGSTLKDAIKLAEFLRDNHMQPEQVQDFYPTPGSVSTCMYYTGLDPDTLKPVYVPKTYEEKQMQRALLQYKNPKNYNLVYKALTLAGREDLIGYDKHCLIKPKGEDKNGKNFERKGSFRKGKGKTKSKNRGFKEDGYTSRSGGRNRRK